MTKHRPKKPSNAVVKGAAVGTPWSIITSYAAVRLATNYNVPLDVTAAGIALVIGGIQSVAQYFARGGREGEAD